MARVFMSGPCREVTGAAQQKKKLPGPKVQGFAWFRVGG